MKITGYWPSLLRYGHERSDFSEPRLASFHPQKNAEFLNLGYLIFFN